MTNKKEGVQKGEIFNDSLSGYMPIIIYFLSQVFFGVRQRPSSICDGPRTATPLVTG
jgi:hypothetical protein